MTVARVDDNAPLDAGRYALVLNRVGYEFTIKGPPKSLDFCLEGFETANGTVFTQCRAPIELNNERTFVATLKIAISSARIPSEHRCQIIRRRVNINPTIITGPLLSAARLFQ